MSNIFSELSHQSDKYWRNDITLGDNKVPPETRDIYDSLKYPKYPLREEEIKRIFSVNANECTINFKNLYLPPLDNNMDFVPILSMGCNLKNDCEMSLRVEMQGYDKNKKSIGFGFRFESPHIGGNHDYWHMQVITENDGLKLGCPEWLPVNDPCIPIKVKKPIDLIFFMLLCFYGKRAYKLFNNLSYLDSKYKNFSSEHFS